MVISTSSRLPGGAFGLLRKRTCPTTAFDGDDVVVPFGTKKAKRRPEPTTAATSKASKTRRVLPRLAGGGESAGGSTAGGAIWEGCALTLAGVFVPGFGNKRLPGLRSVGAVKGVCLSFADGVNAEGTEMRGGGEECNENGVTGAGVIPSGWEGWSGLEEVALVLAGVALGFISSAGTATLRDSATAMVMADALGKRASGSLAMLLRMTSEKVGGILGLRSAGGVGSSWKCCIRIAMTESPRNGVTPVLIS